MNPVPWQREVTVTTPNSTPPTNTPSPGCSQRKVILANPNGLHMRPSAQVVQLAEQFHEGFEGAGGFGTRHLDEEF